MSYDPQQHHRRSIRLKGYDYTLPGAYFVTLVTWQHRCIFGHITDGEMHLSTAGKLVNECWMYLPQFFPLKLDESVVMPNHFHGIISILDSPGRLDKVSTTEMDEHTRMPDRKMFPTTQSIPRGTKPGSLGAVVQSFKYMCSRKIRTYLRSQAKAATESASIKVWQRNYYERIIRDEVELERIRTYIRSNPQSWQDDQLYR